MRSYVLQKNEDAMATVTKRKRGDSYLALLWLPLAAGLLAAVAVFMSSGAHGFDLLWIRWSPGTVGFLVFVALFAVLSLFYLARGLFRWINRVAAPSDPIPKPDQSASTSTNSDEGIVMKRPTKKYIVLGGIAILVALAIGSYLKARNVANDLVGRPPAYTKSWFQPLYKGYISPRWGFTYWSGGETGGMIAEVHVSVFGAVRYRKGYPVSGSNIHGIDS